MRDNRLNRQPSGPGRSTKRTRTASAPGAAVAAKTASASRPAGRKPRIDITARALIALVVIVVVAFSLANSLRVWYLQSGALVTAQAQIAERAARVDSLKGELERWNDPAYVKAQARARLGWVMPGDVGYRVVDANGQVLSGSSEIEGIGSAKRNEQMQWWDRLASSMKQADIPATKR